MLIFLLSACSDAPPSVVLDPEMSTIAHVWATSPTPSRAWVEYGADETYGSVSPVSSVGFIHDIALVGLHPAQTWHYRVVTDMAGELVASEDATFDTGPLPEWIPPFEITGGPVAEHTIFTWWSVVDMQSVVLIVDPAGEIVWYQRPEQLAQGVRLSADGEALLYLDIGIGQDPDAALVRAPLDGSTPTRTPTPYAHHDFVERPDGSIGFLSAEVRDVDGVEVLGDLLHVLEDGAITEVWNAFDSLPMVENGGFGQRPIDWTHANGLAWSSGDATWQISLYWDRTVLAVDGQGTRQWSFGGPESDWRLSPESFHGPQHSPRWEGDDLLLFDNAYEEDRPRLSQYTFDHDTRRATLTWSWQPPEAMAVRLMGDLDRLEDGSTISAWAEVEQLRWLGPDGSEQMRLQFDDDGMVGKLDHTPTLWDRDAEFPWITLPH
jgi:hypothetical protein